jgi:small GTP-binding protein
MKNISKTMEYVNDDIELQNLYNELSVLEKNLDAEEFSVVCVGIYNAGKSTLMNALIDDVENITFQVGEIPTTAQEQSYRKEGFLFLDTPGLDANDEDEQKIKKSVQNADAIIFCHNIATGELDHPEVEFLHFISRHDYLKEKILFVLTKISEKKSDEINATHIKIANQLKNIFGIIDPTIIPICSHNYQKGLKEKKKLLLQNSNITQLKNEIILLKERNIDDLKRSRSSKIDVKINELIILLEEKKKALVCEMEAIQMDHNKRQDEIDFDSRQIIDIVAQKHKQYLEILNGD